MPSSFLEFIGRRRARTGALVLSMLAGVALSLPVPLVSKYLIDDVLIDSNADLLPWIILVFVIVVAMQVAVGRLSAWLQSSCLQDYVTEMRIDIVDRYIDSTIDVDLGPGKLVAIIGGDISRLGSVCMGILATLCRSAFSAIGYALMLLVLNVKLACISLALFPAYFAWTKYVGNKIQALTKQARELSEGMLSSAGEIDRNLETLKAYGFGKIKRAEFAQSAVRINAFAKKAAMYQNFVNSVSGIISSTASVLPMLVGALLVIKGDMTVGELVVFNAYCAMLFPSLTSLIELNTKIKLADAYQQRLDEAKALCGTNGGHKGGDLKAVHEPSGIRLCDYALSPNGQPILKIENLTISPADLMLISGDNATGKSLLLKTLSRLSFQYSGHIYLGEKSAMDYQEREYFKKVIYVSSEQNLICSTLRDELSQGCTVPCERAQRVFSEFGLERAISALPQGLDTHCGTAQRNLNYGSMQKIRIFRALIRNPKFLLLDEMLSNIDVHTRESILQTIRINFPEMAVVVVEHNIADASMFDRVLEIKDGVLVDRGY